MRTDEEHEASVRLIEPEPVSRTSFVFKYSPRPGTNADKRLVDDVPDEVKRRRNVELLALQERISAEHNAQLVGQTFEVLVEGYSKAALRAQEAEQSRGEEVERTRADGGGLAVDRPARGAHPLGSDRRVHRPRRRRSAASQPVRITEATALTLHGELVPPA